MCVYIQLNYWLQWLQIVIIFNLWYYVTIVVDRKSCKKHIIIVQDTYVYKSI